MSWLRKYSWLLIVLFFLAVITKWVLVVRYANEHRPQSIEIPQQATPNDRDQH